MEYRPQLDEEIEHQLVRTGKAIIYLNAHSDGVFYGIPEPVHYSNGKICSYYGSFTKVINLQEYIEYLRSMCYNVEIGTDIRYVYSRYKATSKDSKQVLTKLVVTLDPNCIK